MAETYRTGSSRTATGTRARTSPYGAGEQSGAFSSGFDGDFQDYKNDRMGNRREHPRTRSGLALDDGIILLGILIGGMTGYMIASSVNTDRAGKQARRSFGGSGGGRHSNHQAQSSSRRSVEHDETTDLIASNKVESTAVYNRSGEKLGEVYNFMVGKRSGQVAYAVMSFGGFLGIGQKYHPLPWNMLTYDTNKKGYVVDVDKDQLMGAPSYGAGEEPFSQPDYGRNVRDYWASQNPGSPASV